MDWDKLMNNEGNPSQKWTRDIRPKVHDAIDQLALLAHKLPNVKQAEIFGPESIAKLVTALLFPVKKDFDFDDELDIRRTKIAALLVEKGLVKCMSQYTEVIQRRPELGEDLIKGLKKSDSICKAISLEIESRKTQSEILKKNNHDLTYLFNWNRLGDYFDIRFREYLQVRHNVRWTGIAEVRSLNETTITIVPRQNEGQSYIMLSLSEGKKRVKMTIYDTDGAEKAATYLITKKQDGELNVFDKKKSREYNTIPASIGSNNYTDL
jgi:hypothetical protein